MEKKNIKKAIWIYAVVLFTSAFILLLFTYISQNKLSTDLIDYRNKLSIEEKKKINFQTDLYTVTKENEKLQKQIDEIKKETEDLEKNKKSLENEQTKLREKNEKTIEVYEYLIEAENQYLKGNIIECATVLLKKCDPLLLNYNAYEKYNNLVSKTYFEASRKLYIQGYENYKNKQYKEAIDNFNLALEFDKNSYIADDCYYFISYSYYKMGNKESAKNTLQIIIKNYPDSSYKNDVLALFKELLG